MAPDLMLSFFGVFLACHIGVAKGDLGSDLLQLTASIQGPLSLNKSDWTASAASLACQWSGIGCQGAAGSQQLISINLSGRTLVGTINASALGLPSFTQLTSLNISRNMLNGTLPSWPQPINFTSLDLSHNNMSGSLPAAWAETAPNLAWLDVSSNSLTGTLPLDWGYLDSLSFANLSANNLTGTVMPLEWSEGLQGLSELWLGNNSLAGSIPSEHPAKLLLVLGTTSDNKQICGTVPRNTIFANGTGFVAPLPSCGTLEQGLALLDWAETCPNLPQVAAAQQWFGWTNATAAVPCSWSGVVRCDAQLLGIGLPYTGISCAFSPAWDALGPVLNSLQLEGNPLQGQLPASWGQSWTNVSDFTFTGSQLQGTLPREWGLNGSFPNLFNIIMVGNANLTGPLPPEWGQDHTGLQALRQLWLDGSQLTGSLPPAWGAQLPSLWEISFGGTNLSGTVPDAWYNLTGLKSLKAFATGVSGSLPASWARTGLTPASSLSVLDLGSTKISGTLPPWGANGSMPQLWVLLLGGNPGLTGPIPSSFASPPIMNTQGNGQFYVQNTSLCNPASSLQAAAGSSVATFVKNFTSALPTCTAAPSPAPGPAYPPPAAAAVLVPPPAAVVASTKSSGSSSSAGPIAGGVVGGLAAVLAVLAIIAVHLVRRRNRRRRVTAESSRQSSAPTLKALMADTSSSDTTATTPSGTKSRSRDLQLTTPASSRSSRSGMGIPGPGRGHWELDADRITIDRHPDGSLWKLGSGAFGTVYKARLDEVQPVAVKMLQPGNFKQATIDAFMNEVAILHDCRSPHVVLMVGACLEEDRLCLVQELLASDLWHALGDHVQGETLMWRRRGKQIALDVARGLHYLHSNSIMHLDLKSQNILLSTEGRAKIADTGLAVAMMMDETHRSSLSARGTFMWMAPEMMVGERCSNKTDIFSFGVVLWEIVTQERPARGYNRSISCPDEAPEYVAELVRSCKSPSPEERPTAREIVQMLEAAED